MSLIYQYSDILLVCLVVVSVMAVLLVCFDRYKQRTKQQHVEGFSSSSSSPSPNPWTPWKDKRVLLIGSTRGIGYATASAALQGGCAAVLIHGRSFKSVDAAAQRLGSDPRVTALPWDLTEPCPKEQLVAWAKDGVDVIVHTALGQIHVKKPGLLDMTADEWRQGMNIQVDSIVTLLQVVHPYFNKGARIVTVSSGAVDLGVDTHEIPAAYILQKATVERLTEQLAAEPMLQARQVVVTCFKMTETVCNTAIADAAAKELALQCTAEPSDMAAALGDLLKMPAADVHGRCISSDSLRFPVPLDASNGSNPSNASANTWMRVIEQGLSGSGSGSGSGGSHLYDPSQGTLLQGTNALGSSKLVGADLSTYPMDQRPEQLLTLLATRTNANTTAENICIFHGTLEAIDNIIKCFSPRTSKTKLYHSTPEWPLFEQFLQQNKHRFDVTAVACSLKEDEHPRRLNHLLKAMQSSNRNLRPTADSPAFVYLTSPHMPSGQSIETKDMVAFLDRLPDHVYVVLDQCYLEFSQNNQAFDGAKWLSDRNKARDRLIVLRTLSKFYGLAAIRLAYSIASPATTALLQMQQINPFLNQMMIDAATKTIQDESYIQSVRDFYQKEKQRIYQKLKKKGRAYVPSDANFILVDMGDQIRWFQVRQRLEEAKLLPMARSLFYDKYFMMTIEKPDVNDRVIELL
jgi:histidinol-phosphate/aromatic aminotransferase/cobyric acid decarboxylase-like protein/NAD(P)-dependent dehydrogenase (short-subunit alcohol dehydrogenase family)